MKKLIAVITMAIAIVAPLNALAFDGDELLRNGIAGGIAGWLYEGNGEGARRGAGIAIGITVVRDLLGGGIYEQPTYNGRPTGRYIGGHGEESAYAKRKARLEAQLQRYRECRAEQRAERDMGFRVRTRCRDPRR